MKIVVLVKEVPDTYGDRKLSPRDRARRARRVASGARRDRRTGDRGRAVVRRCDAGTEVVVLSMAPESAAATVRKGLAMGAGVGGADRRRGPARRRPRADGGGARGGGAADRVRPGDRRQPLDGRVGRGDPGDGGRAAGRAGGDGAVGGRDRRSAVSPGTRATDGATMRVTAPLPAVISITEALPDARFPNFKGIMAAKKKPFETLIARRSRRGRRGPGRGAVDRDRAEREAAAAGGREDRRRGRRGREARRVPHPEPAGVRRMAD